MTDFMHNVQAFTVVVGILVGIAHALGWGKKQAVITAEKINDILYNVASTVVNSIEQQHIADPGLYTDNEDKFDEAFRGVVAMLPQGIQVTNAAITHAIENAVSNLTSTTKRIQWKQEDKNNTEKENPTVGGGGSTSENLPITVTVQESKEDVAPTTPPGYIFSPRAG